MLCLTTHVGDDANDVLVVVDGVVVAEIAVTAARGSRVELGIEAPRRVEILRRKVWERKQKESENANVSKSE